MKDQIVGFIAPVCGDDVFLWGVRIEVHEHGMRSVSFVRFLTRLDDHIEECFGDYINESI